MATTPSPALSAGQMPQMPQAARPKEDGHAPPRSSEDSERRRLLHNSWQTVVAVPSIQERPSQEMSPSPQQAGSWPGTSNALVPEATDMARLPSQDSRPPSRPPGPGQYGRSTSNDYTMYDPYMPATQRTQGPPPQVNYAGNDEYMSQPYRRAPTFDTVRETTEPEGRSGKADRYMPLATDQTPKKQASFFLPNESYGGGGGIGEEGTPSKRPRGPKRRGTSIYFVKEGEDDGSGTPPPGHVLELPFTGWLKGPLRNMFVAWLGEFVGTTLFLWFAFAGTIVANIGAQQAATNSTTQNTAGFSPIVTIYVSIAFGFSLMVNVWVFFRVSGGLFNPAVTLGMVMTKTIGWLQGVVLVTAQLVGAILASFLVQVMFPYEFSVKTTLSAETSMTRGVFIELVLTSELVFTVFMLAKEKHKATYMAPVGIGLALFIAEMVGVFFTGGSLNPARSFGPCVVTGKFESEHWIYWVGPALGAILAVAFYRFIKILEYENANPGQDHNELDEKAARRSMDKETV